MLLADTLATLALVATVVLGIPALGLCVLYIWRVAQRMHVIHEAIIGRPEAPGIEPIPSMVERFAAVDGHLAQQDKTITKIDARLTKVETELSPNSGKSLRDKVDQIARAVVREEG